MRSTALLLSVGLLTAFAGFIQACATTSDDGAAVSPNEIQAGPGANVLSSKNDTLRTGHNDQERILHTGNVKGTSFGRIYSRPIDGQVYAQPLYVSNVNGKNLVIVATEHNSVYAFDADNTAADAPPVWEKNFGPSLPAQATGCGLLTPEIGITATPVIDTASNTIWFTSRHAENGKAVHKLNAIDLTTGEHKPSSPVVITAKARGNGTTSVNGVITFDPLKQMSRAGLLKVGNRIVIGFGSQCDIRPYHGWVLGYDATTLVQNKVHITTPNGGEGSIWNGGVGMNADENGDIYYPSADAYDRSGQTPWNGEGNEANSLIRLTDTGGADWKVATKFSPFDQVQFAIQDASFGNGGGILLPGTNLYLSGDKRGQVFVVDRTNMGGQSPADGNAVQKWQGSTRGTWGGGAFYKGANRTGIYYSWGTGDALKAYKFDGERFDTRALVNTTTQTGYPGVALSISSDGTKAGTGIVWGVKGKRTNPGLAASTGAGALVAFDAADITKQLYSSDDNTADMLGNATKFAPPTIAGGKVFVGTSSNQLVVYGLRNGAPPPNQGREDAGAGPVEPEPVDAGPVTTAPTWTDVYTTLIGPGTPGHCSGTGGCHTQLKGGFKCGTDKDTCFAGLVAKGLINTANPSQSSLINEAESPLAWFGGGMPIDNPSENPEAAAKIKAWVLDGAKNN